MASCANHPEDKALTTCLDCLKPICEVCYRFQGGRDLCAGCAARVLRARKARNATLAAVAVGLAAPPWCSRSP